MDQPTSKKYWRVAKWSFGTFFSILLATGFWVLHRMAVVRSTIDYPESGLFLARALILIPMGACLIMALWCFISVKISLKSKWLRNVLLVMAIICGLATFALCVYCFQTVNYDYSQLPGGRLL